MTNLYDSLITSTLPYDIAEKPEVKALALIFSKQLKRIIDYSDCCDFFIDLDLVDEKMLDYLAIDFNVVEYNSNLTVEQKKKLLKNAFLNWQTAGTKNAVQNIIQTVNPNFSIMEWPEYDGDPGTYRVNIVNTRMSDDDLNTVLKYIEAKGRISAHLDSIDIIIESSSLLASSGSYIHTGEVRTLQVGADNRNYPLIAMAEDNLVIASDDDITAEEVDGNLIITADDVQLTAENGHIYVEREE